MDTINTVPPKSLKLGDTFKLISRETYDRKEYDREVLNQ